MHFDDRLATVLRHRAAGERAARTQYRQLLDLLGGQARSGDESLEAAAYLRLTALGEFASARERAQIVAESGGRIRNPRLVEWFGEAEPDVAAAALARASLPEAEWARIIPQLPIRARGFLRNRGDLPAGAVRILDRLGVSDRGLPEPERAAALPLKGRSDYLAAEEEAAHAAPSPTPARHSLDKPAIGEIVRRIEAFKKSRDRTDDGRPKTGNTPGNDTDPADPLAPRLPLDERHDPAPRGRSELFAFSTDVDGRIEWADAAVAPMVVGTDLVAQHALGRAGADDAFAVAFFDRQPVREVAVALSGADRIAGEWLVDATPRFTRSDGRFYGFVGRFRRPAYNTERDRAESEADRIRQLLHELRTPVNAIQGFAEVIQQQLFGATPHEYRALAASIAGDSARMLAGFDELDRLAQLEGAVIELDGGSSDILPILQRQVDQLQSVLSPRVARLEATWPSGGGATVALTENESELLAWRVLATIASATGAGESVALVLTMQDGVLELRSVLPGTLAAAKDVFSTDTRPMGGALSPGIFGAGFALRLARAEARAAGGDLSRMADTLVLTLPLLTVGEAAPSPTVDHGRATG